MKYLMKKVSPAMEKVFYARTGVEYNDGLFRHLATSKMSFKKLEIIDSMASYNDKLSQCAYGTVVAVFEVESRWEEFNVTLIQGDKNTLDKIDLVALETRLRKLWEKDENVIVPVLHIDNRDQLMKSITKRIRKRFGLKKVHEV